MNADPQSAGKMAQDGRQDLCDLTLEELTRFAIEVLAERPYRAAQIYRWIHQRGATDFDQMTDLSKELRQKLPQVARLRPLEQDLAQHSEDGTVKYRFRTRDGKLIESV